MVLDTIISSMVDLITDPIKEDIVMPINCDRNLKRLRDEVEQLQNKRIRLQHSVEEAIRNGEEIFPDATNWLSTTEKDIEEAELILGEEEEAKKKLLGGIFPNFRTLYQLSKKADEKALAVHDQLQNARGLYPISFRPRLQPIVEHGEALQSRVEILDQIVEALKDPILNPILVYGMGGIGKTTLAKEVLRQAVDLKLFDDVALVAVSETPNLRRIQGDLADALGLTFRAEGDSGRAMELHNRLNNDQKKVLIIFDDVWEELHLSDIGIPSGEPSKGCRIILTSRKKNVFCIEMPTKKEFPLGLLEEDEAWRLFEKIVSIEFLADNRDFCDLAKQVVNKCGGLPLLIQIVAADLRNNKHPHAWRDMLKQLESVKGTEMYDKVHKVIESSYEKMKEEEAKSLFLLCHLFGNSNIRIHNLLIYCVGLGLCKRDSIEESRDRVLTLIDKLKNESLLLEGDQAGFVKIHNVVSDIAAAIASKEHGTFVVKGRIESRDLESTDCRRISFPYCDIPALPKVLQCPKAEVFSVFLKYLRLDIPDSFFEGVTKCKVLHFAGVRFMSSLPSSLGFLTGLQTLSLDGCWGLTNVAIVAQLKHLQVLSFAGSDVAQLPKEIEAFAQLKLLDLTDCISLKVIPSNVLSNLHSLEELYLFRSFVRWGTEGNASVVELKNLHRLKTLEIQVQDDKLLPEDWFFNGIQNYKIFIGDWHHSDDEEASSRMLKLELKTSFGSMDRIKEFLGGTEVLYLHEVNAIENLLCDSSMENINSFQRLRVLSIYNYTSLREVIPFSSGKCLPHLEEMKVHWCRNMEAIVCEGHENEVMEFSQLTSLYLSDLPHLKCICRTTRGMVSFPNLTSLEIWQCHSLKYVFTTSMVKSLQQLKKLEISCCKSMEEIILVTKFEEAAEDKINMIVLFPSLTSLKINKCESLKYVFTTSMVKSLQQLKELDISFCNSMEKIMLVTKCEEVVALPELKELKIRECSSLKNFVSKYSDRSNNNESTDEYLFNKNSCQKLRVLKIQKCDLLREVLPFSKCLPNLQEMEVQSCSNMEAIVGEGNENGVMELTQLTSLMLISLPLLRGICRTTRGTVLFPSLTSLKIYKCESLKYVFTTSMVKSLQQLKELDISCCNSMEKIMLVTKCEEVVAFPELKELKIRECSSLKNFVSKDSDRSNNNESTDEYLFNKLVTFPNLEIMHIESLGDFIHLWHQQFADTQSFSKLKSLYIGYCEKLSIVFPSNVYRRFERLESLGVSYCGEVKEIYEYKERNVLQAFALQRVTIFFLRSLKHIWSKDIDEAFSFENLQSVEVQCCLELKYVIPASIACGLLQLQELEIRNCGVEMIIAEPKNEGSEGASIHTFEWPKFKSLIVCNCDELIRFGSVISKAKQNIATQDSLNCIQKVIPNVEVLTLDHHSLKAIQSDDHGFPVESSWKLKEVSLGNLEKESVPVLFDFLRRIYSLEKLVFENCLSRIYSLEKHVFENSNWGDILSLLDERAVGDQQQLCNLGLEHLHLNGVSKLKRIVTEDSQLNPILQSLNIAQSSSSVFFKNLTTLRVKLCENMTSLVTASTAKSMIQLMELRVSHCNMMEDIIDTNENGDSKEEHDDDVIIFNKLKLLELNKLPNLNSFCSGNYMFNFPLLEKVSIDGCNQMKNFCAGVLSTPKLQGIRYDYKQLWEENLNTTIASQLQQNRSADMSEDGDDYSEMLIQLFGPVDM